LNIAALDPKNEDIYIYREKRFDAIVIKKGIKRTDTKIEADRGSEVC
jgi:hypothetical protein